MASESHSIAECGGLLVFAEGLLDATLLKKHRSFEEHQDKPSGDFSENRPKSPFLHVKTHDF